MGLVYCTLFLSAYLSSLICIFILDILLASCYDYRILLEYQQVLERPRFRFRPSEVNTLLDFFKQVGNSVVVPPIDIPFADQSDRNFYEVAKYCGAVLITGNLKHFPDDDKILSVSSFLEMNGWAVNG